MATKTAAKAKPPLADSEPPRLPLEPCASWADAEALARDALAYILQDGSESGANRIRAAELVLECAGGKLGDHGEAGQLQPGAFEVWLQKFGGVTRL